MWLHYRHKEQVILDQEETDLALSPQTLLEDVMKEVQSALVMWLHISATVVWIGGIVFILAVALPSSKVVLGAEAGKMMGEISKRFTPLANYSILLLVISGIILAAYPKSIPVFPTNTSMLLKYTLVVVMIVIHFYRGLILTAKISKTSDVSKKTSLQKLSLNLVRFNLTLGLIVVFFSVLSANIRI